MVIQELRVLGRQLIDEVHLSPCISGSTLCQQLLVILILMTWLRLSGFSTVKLLFFSFSVLFLLEGFHPTQKGREIEIHLLERGVSQYLWTYIKATILTNILRKIIWAYANTLLHPGVSLIFIHLWILPETVITVLFSKYAFCVKFLFYWDMIDID